jgi:hypothetical protein
MTTEKQHTKRANSEFCCCCQEGNIRNVCWWEGGNQGTIGGSLGDGTLVQLHHLVLEISVGQEALQVTSNIKQEVLSRTCKAFFYYCIDLIFHILLSIIAVISFYFFEEHAAEV